MAKITVIQEWWEKGRGKKKEGQVESLPAKLLRQAKKTLKSNPSYGAALDVQKLNEAMTRYRESTLKPVESTI